jgi:hypothetical protein
VLRLWAQAVRVPSIVLALVNLLVLRLLVWELKLVKLRSVSGVGADIDWDRDFIRPVAAPTWAADRFTGLAVWLLPGEYQARYAAEFGCELYDLAVLGASRPSQLRFSLRILFRAWPLRRVLLQSGAADGGERS